MKRYASVDDFISDQDNWKDALVILREILHETELEEKVKWSFPCYTLQNKNVVGLGSFKSYCGLWFFQGVFLEDPAGVLVNAQDGKTKGMRQWRFNSIEEIDRDLVKAYVEEAIQNQKEGKEVKAARPVKKVVVPPEMAALFTSEPDYQLAFDSFTPGKQREFAEYITEAKREATKLSRLEKIKPMLLNGVGLNDKYKR
ncbi:MAG: DUF1801 domain-containing protein [Bacteroidota bacterium]